MFSEGQRYLEVFEISCARSGGVKERYNTGRRGGGNHITSISRVIGENINVLERRNRLGYGGKDGQLTPHLSKKR